MLYEMLKPHLPMLLQSFGIAIAVVIIRTGGHPSVEDIVKMALLIFGAFNILGAYAPVVMESASRAVGMGTGMMIGGTPADSDTYAK
jgi:hypothetical protein